MNMKHTIAALFFLSVFSLRAEIFVFDKIDAVVLGKDTAVITFSDIQDKKNLSGQYEKLDRLIRNFTLVFQAYDEKMPIEEDIADEFIDNMMRKNHIKLEDIGDMFGNLGLTFAEGKDLLKRSEILRRFEGQRFYSRLAVTEGMIEAEYNVEPIFKDAWCKIKVAYIAFDAKKSKAEQKNTIEAMMKDEKMLSEFDWSQEFLVPVSDLAYDKKFIADMPDQTGAIVEEEQSFAVYYLIEKHDKELLRLEECKSAIIERLMQRNNEILMREYEKLVSKYYTILKPS